MVSVRRTPPLLRQAMRTTARVRMRERSFDLPATARVSRFPDQRIGRSRTARELRNRWPSTPALAAKERSRRLRKPTVPEGTALRAARRWDERQAPTMRCSSIAVLSAWPNPVCVHGASRGSVRFRGQQDLRDTADVMAGLPEDPCETPDDRAARGPDVPATGAARRGLRRRPAPRFVA